MQASSVLLSMLARGYGLQTIIDYAGQQFPGSIAAIVSTSGRLLACSSAEEISSPIIRSQIEQGFLNEATYELCRNGKLLSRFSTERHSFIVDDIQDQDLSWIMSAVRISDTVAAYFVAAGEKGGFREQDLPLADLFCQAFSIILSSENETGSSLHEGGVLINDLLQGVEYEEAALKSRIDMLQLTIPQVIQVVVVRGSHTATDKKSTQLVLNSISDSICRTFFFFAP